MRERESVIALHLESSMQIHPYGKVSKTWSLQNQCADPQIRKLAKTCKLRTQTRETIVRQEYCTIPFAQQEPDNICVNIVSHTLERIVLQRGNDTIPDYLMYDGQDVRLIPILECAQILQNRQVTIHR